MRRGVSIDMGGGYRLCPICGESYKRGTYKVEHVWASSQHVSALAERKRKRSNVRRQDDPVKGDEK